jgi:hypothetical protein
MLRESNVSMDEVKARDVATKFLEQYHNNVSIKNIMLENDAYVVTLVTGLTEKKIIHVRVAAKDLHIIGFSYPMDFGKIVDMILELGNEIRYVLVIDSKGNALHGKMAPGKTILVKKEDQITNLPTDLHILRQLLKMFDESLGRTTFVHFERERMHILMFYVRDLIFCITCERSLESLRLVELSNIIGATSRKHIEQSL